MIAALIDLLWLALLLVLAAGLLCAVELGAWMALVALVRRRR